MLGIPCEPKQVKTLDMSEDSSDNYIGLYAGVKERYGTFPPELSAILDII